ncbi:MAG: hypothetical protein QGG36_20990 [Pirellulaceae bacterium]|jgi:hypothetical protein|nr:hypothetical protein [Pirellulaceae bacterium]MDP7018295.1 hypothetical protein [Pirellulaceae bacterium]
MESVSELWKFMLWGYPLTVALEAPILLAGLAPRHSISRRLLAAFWLTACSYPIVAVVLPVLMEGSPRVLYLAVAEVFAPASECALFWLAFPADRRADLKPAESAPKSTWVRDGLVIVAANLFSFSAGEAMRWWGWIA